MFKFLKDISPFMGSPIPPTAPFWTSGDVCPGLQSQIGFLFAYFLTYVILRFTPGATPADCTGVSMVTKPFQFTYFTGVPSSIGGGSDRGSNPRPSNPVLTTYSMSAHSECFSRESLASHFRRTK